MSNVGVLFNRINLVFVDETFNVGAFFDKSSTQEVDFTRLKSHKDVKDDDYEEVGFVRALAHCSI